jgi:CubicO group peptidase (beta-lactamase class C family)
MKKIMINSVKALLFIGLIIGCNPSNQETTLLKTDVDRTTFISNLEKVVPELMKKADVPGLSIAVIRDGKIIWSGAFGIKNTKTGEPVTEDTIFEAASLTKPFFAYMVMKLVEAGELDLDKPLIEYVPEDYLVKKYIHHPMDLEGFKNTWFRTITTRMVLSHSSGLPHGGPRKPLPIHFEPGTEYRYSADGYMYLQRVIEHLKGEPLRDIMRKMVIEPLNMTNSGMVWQERYETQSSVGHDVFSETTGRFRKRKQAHSAASLYTTAKDYAKFVAAVLNDAGLKKNTVDLMLTPQINVEGEVFWSLGFGIQRTENGDGFWQWGDYGIFRNYIVAYKKHQIGVVYLTNSYNGLSLAPDIVKHAIGGGKDLGLAYLDYARYDSPRMLWVKTIKDKGADEAIRLFPEMKEKYPDDIDESNVNWLGYTLLNAGRNEEAIKFFKLNVETFPDSTNVYDSLAEAYMRSGETELAIQFYRKTLDMIPKDTKADKDFLERLKKGAIQNLELLEKRLEKEKERAKKK